MTNTAGYIVHDNEGIIHGYGTTAEEAYADMRRTKEQAGIRPVLWRKDKKRRIAWNCGFTTYWWRVTAMKAKTHSIDPPAFFSGGVWKWQKIRGRFVSIFTPFQRDGSLS